MVEVMSGIWVGLPLLGAALEGGFSHQDGWRVDAFRATLGAAQAFVRETMSACLGGLHVPAPLLAFESLFRGDCRGDDKAFATFAAFHATVAHLTVFHK